MAVVRLLLVVIGIGTLLALLWRIGPSRIVNVLHDVGAEGLLLLLPSVGIYLLDARGWQATLPPEVPAVPLWRLFVIRMAGEAVNLTTPTGYMGGEPVNSYLLMRDRVPSAVAVASVVTAKTTMTVAQVLFILLGVGLATQRPWPPAMATAVSALLLGVSVGLGVLATGAVVLILLQRQGFTRLLLAMRRRLGVRLRWLDARRKTIANVDQHMMAAYRDRQAMVWSSTVWFLLGWLMEGVEVYVILACLGSPPAPLHAVGLASLSVAVKASTFFIPGSLGAQEGGNVLLAMAYGYTDTVGMAFALLRRFREVVWIVFGLVCLTWLGKGLQQNTLSIR
jgi:glycosyltransferase 2 family protein